MSFRNVGAIIQDINEVRRIQYGYEQQWESAFVQGLHDEAQAFEFQALEMRDEIVELEAELRAARANLMSAVEASDLGLDFAAFTR